MEHHDKPKTVTMEAIALHTCHGKEYDVGDTYELEEALADSVVLQGKAIRADAKPAKKAKADDDEPHGRKPHK